MYVAASSVVHSAVSLSHPMNIALYNIAADICWSIIGSRRVVAASVIRDRYLDRSSPVISHIRTANKRRDCFFISSLISRKCNQVADVLTSKSRRRRALSYTAAAALAS